MMNAYLLCFCLLVVDIRKKQASKRTFAQKYTILNILIETDVDEENMCVYEKLYNIYLHAGMQRLCLDKEQMPFSL